LDDRLTLKLAGFHPFQFPRQTPSLSHNSRTSLRYTSSNSGFPHETFLPRDPSDGKRPQSPSALLSLVWFLLIDYFGLSGSSLREGVKFSITRLSVVVRLSRCESAKSILWAQNSLRNRVSTLKAVEPKFAPYRIDIKHWHTTGLTAFATS